MHAAEHSNADLNSYHTLPLSFFPHPEMVLPVNEGGRTLLAGKVPIGQRAKLRL
jgi:hypothetical protein